jgi:hypothetical protein
MYYKLMKGNQMYALFAGDNYYPGGGWADFVKSFDTLDMAKDYVQHNDAVWDWYQIVDLANQKVVDASADYDMDA